MLLPLVLWERLSGFRDIDPVANDGTLARAQINLIQVDIAKPLMACFICQIQKKRFTFTKVHSSRRV